MVETSEESPDPTAYGVGAEIADKLGYTLRWRDPMNKAIVVDVPVKDVDGDPCRQPRVKAAIKANKLSATKHPETDLTPYEHYASSQDLIDDIE